MTAPVLTQRLQHQFAIIADAGFGVAPGMRILDFGCGDGEAVAALLAAGYDAYGCDVELPRTAHNEASLDEGRLRAIAVDAYRLPFENESFDVVLSNEVFEHVRDYPQALAELNRVMKPGAISLHLFPARWMPVEPHVLVPFATVIRALPWLWFWALLGVRNASQRGWSARETALRNRAYLTQHTHYPSGSEIARYFHRFFPRFCFAEGLFLKHSRRGAGAYRYLHALPGLLRLYRACRHRVVLAGK